MPPKQTADNKKATEEDQHQPVVEMQSLVNVEEQQEGTFVQARDKHVTADEGMRSEATSVQARDKHVAPDNGLLSVAPSVQAKDKHVAADKGMLSDIPTTAGDTDIFAEQKKTRQAQTYANTKSVAQGFLNISLLSANAGQLKIVLQEGSDQKFYELLLTLLVLSILLQLVVSYLLASKYMIELDGYEDKAEQDSAMKHNGWATFLIALITAVNVTISTFISTASSGREAKPPTPASTTV